MENISGTLNFIPDDGYTEKAYIQLSLGMHGELRFSYRPMLVENRSAVLRSFDKMTAEAADIKSSDLMAEHITEWDVKDARGEIVPVSVDVMRRIRPQLFYRMWGIMLGTGASDIDPKWEESAKTREADLQFTTASQPKAIGEVREEDAEKNSDGG